MAGASSDPATAASGGPDGFGYRFTDSSEPDGPVYNFEDISPTGAVSTVSTQDYAAETVNLGFTFSYYGTGFTTTSICSNGFLQFGSSDTTYPGQPIPLASAPNNITSGNPLLAQPGDYGGKTRTMPPLVGSPAINAAGASALATDQRCAPCPVGAASDIGAVEALIPESRARRVSIRSSSIPTPQTLKSKSPWQPPPAAGLKSRSMASPCPPTGPGHFHSPTCTPVA